MMDPNVQIGYACAKGVQFKPSVVKKRQYPIVVLPENDVSEKKLLFRGLLHVAIKNEQYATFLKLLDAGADVNEITPEGGTLLHFAVKYTVKPICQGSKFANPGDFIPALLKRGVDPFVVDRNGQNALQLLMSRKEDVSSAASLLIEYMEKQSGIF